MNCTRYRQLISRYVDDEVTPRQRSELLAHVGVCRDCAAWLARARQTDVLLKSVGDTRPSDAVRSAIFTKLHEQDRSLSDVTRQPQSSAPVRAAKPKVRSPRIVSAVGILVSSFLLRFDPSPRRMAFGFFAVCFASLGMLYWFNLLPQFWSNKLGFEVQADAAAVESTPIPMEAVSSNLGSTSYPSLVLAQPGPGALISTLTSPVVMRFDMPMDRGSVESALLITPPAAGDLAWDADNQLRWTPSASGLLRGITYTVSLSGSVLSMAGAPLRGTSIWSFRTRDPYLASSVLPDGSSVGPADPLVLGFDAPMQPDAAEKWVTLYEHRTGREVPVTFDWNADGTGVAVAPVKPLAVGDVSLRVASDAPTKSGDTLGRAYEFTYSVEMTAPRVRMPAGRLSVGVVGEPYSLAYEVVGEDVPGVTLDGALFEVYSLPAEYLSLVGAQASAWPQRLPDGLPGGLEKSGFSYSKRGVSVSDKVSLPTLRAGTYLIVAKGLMSNGKPATASIPMDWQLLVIGDRRLIALDNNATLWAVTETGRAWTNAEVSLYSPEGELIEKGLTDGLGLYSPTIAIGVGLAIARDPSGHTAPLVLDINSAMSKPDANPGTLAANLVTDSPAYRPGDVVNFHLNIEASVAQAADAKQANATAELLTHDGYVISTLNLAPDASGGVAGLFSLAPTAAPGPYTIRARWGTDWRAFPLEVVAAERNTLSVAVLPVEATPESAVLTRTVSVLGPSGSPVEGAVVTGTLHIHGDLWGSEPYAALTNSAGMATIQVPLPAWLARFNDPGLYFHAEASYADLLGTAGYDLDFTSQRNAAAGMTQVVAPHQNVAVVARLEPSLMPDDEEHFKVRVVLLDEAHDPGDVLLIVTSPSGERVRYVLNLTLLPGADATIDLPLRFAGGTISVHAAMTDTARVLDLAPVGPPTADLFVAAPLTATASSAVPVRLSLSGPDGSGMAGSASLVWRRVSGSLPEETMPWQPGVVITASGTITLTMQTPSYPGLWYLYSEAPTPGVIARGWSVVQVLPAPWLQLPPAVEAEAGSDWVFGVRVFNTTDNPLKADIQARSSVQSLTSTSSRGVAVSAGVWSDQSWQVSANRPGDGRLTFSLLPVDGGPLQLGNTTWPLDVHYRPRANTDVTYTSGTLTGERVVGVAVPWGLDNRHLSLEIRASTSLLPLLAGTARDLYSSWGSPEDGVALAAARLASAAPVAAAYERMGEVAPDSLFLSGVERSSLLQQIYAAQHADGGWSNSLDGTGNSSPTNTAAVLTALYRAAGYEYSDGQVQPDAQVLERALQYLEIETVRPVEADATQAVLDERAYALYTLSLYHRLDGAQARLMLAYASPGADDAPCMSMDGQAHLALALLGSGMRDDALALLDTALRMQAYDAMPSSAPMLMALLQAQAEAAMDTEPFSYVYAARRASELKLRTPQLVEAIMGARQGAGWQSPTATAEAVWALSLYSAMEEQRPTLNEPNLLLEGRPIYSQGVPSVPGELSVVLAGDELHAGTNSLKLRSPSSGEPLYYSLSLIAMR